MSRVDSFVGTGLQVLELLGVALAVLAMLAVTAGIMRSIWMVTFGRATLVLPFAGIDKGATINEILAQQLGEVERLWQQLSRTIRKEEGLVRAEAALVDLGPRGRALADQALDEQGDQFISEQPIAGQAIGPISFAGISVSPETIFSLFYRIRSVVARRTIGGSLHEFGGTVRLSALFVFRKRPGGRPGRLLARRGRGERRRELVVLVRDLERPRQLLDLVDDLAFRIAKTRLEFTSEADSWSAYRAFLEGYSEHVRFLRTGEIAHRERAIALYSAAVEAEPRYCLARYNLGSLLYNRYDEEDNAKAIEHFRSAAESPDQRLKALALAGLTLAYAQNVHRFGLAPDPWVALADEASRQAMQIYPDLEETSFARAWAHQIAGRVTDALDEYRRTVGLPGDTPIERQIKSFAQNNRAWLHLNVLCDPDTAETLLRDALEFPNKMVYANLGDIYKRQKAFDRALAQYERARNLDPRYANGINETGMVYLAMARESLDQRHDDVDQLLVEAERWHGRALDAVPVGATNQREDLRQKFADARSQYGLPDSSS